MFVSGVCFYLDLSFLTSFQILTRKYNGNHNVYVSCNMYDINTAIWGIGK
jgi:hypothetical protein